MFWVSIFEKFIRKLSCSIIQQNNVAKKRWLAAQLCYFQTSVGCGRCLKDLVQTLETELKKIRGIYGATLVLKQRSQRTTRTTCLTPESGRSLGTTNHTQSRQSGCYTVIAETYPRDSFEPLFHAVCFSSLSLFTLLSYYSVPVLSRYLPLFSQQSNRMCFISSRATQA